MLPLRRILHPTDFSDLSRAAFELASALARDYSAELLVLHVYSPPSIFAPDGIAVPLPAEEPYNLRVQLAEIQPVDPRVTVEHHLLDGAPAEQILKFARTRAVDLIVMGTHGATGLTRLLMGSVAEHVTRKATCPVLTIRQPFHSGDEDLVSEALPVAAMA